jgi:hypothetical protein
MRNPTGDVNGAPEVTCLTARDIGVTCGDLAIDDRSGLN